MAFLENIVSSILLSISIFWRWRAHKSACIVGSGDSRGVDDIVDTGIEIIVDDPITIYLGYYDV
jgi:hypothetical protein